MLDINSNLRKTYTHPANVNITTCTGFNPKNKNMPVTNSTVSNKIVLVNLFLMVKCTIYDKLLMGY